MASETVTDAAFETLAAHELAALVDRLTVAAARHVEIATARLTESFQHTISTLRNDQMQIAAENERLTAENAALAWEKNALLDAANEGQRGALIDRLATVFDDIAASTTVDDVMTATASGLIGDFARVALFVLRDNRFECRYQRGFDAGAGIDTLTIPADTDSVLRRAARSDLVLSGDDARGHAAPEIFRAAGTPFIAASMSVRGELLAVMYADGPSPGAQTSSLDERAKLADLLRRHAALTLDQLTIELKTIAELRAYAQMLLDEVEYAYDADTAAKKQDHERRERLGDNLRCARQIYQQRAALEGPSAAALLEAVIARTGTTRADTPFGRDLTAAAAGSDAAPHA